MADLEQKLFDSTCEQKMSELQNNDKINGELKELTPLTKTEQIVSNIKEIERQIVPSDTQLKKVMSINASHRRLKAEVN